MTKSSKNRVSIPLSDVRVFYNEERDMYEVIGKNDTLPGGFLTTIKRGSALEARLKAAFEISRNNDRRFYPESDRIEVNLPGQAFLKYDFPLSDMDVSADARDEEGKVFAITAPHGKSGVSSVAALLASSISLGTLELEKSRIVNKGLSTVIVDMDGDGKIGEFFGFRKEPVSKILDFTSSSRLDTKSALQESFLFHEPTGVHILSGIGIHDVPFPVSLLDLYANIIETLKTMFDVVVIDTGTQDVSSTLLREQVAYPMSDGVIAVLDLETGSKSNLALWATWGKNLVTPSNRGGMGLGREQIGIVINKSFKGGPIDGDDIQKLKQEWAVAAIAAIPMDKKAAEISQAHGKFHDFITHPTAFPAIKRIADAVVSKMGYSIMTWNPTYTQHDAGLSATVSVKSLAGYERLIPVGIDETGSTVSVSFEKSAKNNMMITGAAVNGSLQALYNMRLFLQSSVTGSEVFVSGFGSESPFLKGEKVISNNMELLLLLRNLTSNRITIHENLYVILGALDTLIQPPSEEGMQSRVDKAVRAEILETIRTLSNPDTSPNVHFIFASAQPTSALNSLLGSCNTHMHFAPSVASGKTTSFIEGEFGDENEDYRRLVRNRALFKAGNSVKLIQVFVPISGDDI